MANEAVTSPKGESNLDGKLNDQAQNTEELDATAEGNEDGQGQDADNQEAEITLRSDGGSQPEKDNQIGIRRRINKLNAKREAAEAESSETTQKLAVMDERNRMLQLSIDQMKAQSEATKPPDPNDFDDGALDPKYISAQNAFNQEVIQAAVKKQTDQIVLQQPQPAVSAELLQRQERHYKRAAELGNKDFYEVEEKAIGILGKDIVNHLIENSDRSAELLYYLGINSDTAEELAELVKSHPIKGVLKLGALEADLVVKPAKRNQAPDPDEELEGSVPPSQNASARKLDKLRETARSGDRKDVERLIEFKRELKAKAAAS